MTTPQKPDEFPPQAGGELPDLSLRNFGRRDWDASEDDMGINDPDQQSIFSKRSGIQDPLVRSDSQTDTREDTEVATQETPQDEDSVAEPGQTEVPMPERKGRGTKARPRLVKSKRHLDRARRRQKNYLQERRDKKRLRVFFHRIKMILKLCFVALWSVLLWQTVRSPLWNFDQPRFTVTDAHLVQVSQVSPWVKQQVGKPIYAIDTGKLARQIKQNFDIAERVSVRRELFPARLEILIQEKQPWAEIYAVDPHPHETKKPETTANPASTAKKTPGTPPPAKPVIRPYGLVATSGIISLNGYNYQPGVLGTAPVDKLIVTPRTVFSLGYLQRLRELTWQARQVKGLHLESVDVRNPNRIIFNYAELPVVLGKMNSTATQRLARLESLIPKINEYREGIQYIDLKWEEPTYFHMKPNAKLDLPKPESSQG